MVLLIVEIYTDIFIRKCFQIVTVSKNLDLFRHTEPLLKDDAFIMGKTRHILLAGWAFIRWAVNGTDDFSQSYRGRGAGYGNSSV